MFTGLVEGVAKVKTFKEENSAYLLQLELPSVIDDMKIGDSLACNGCCLTLIKLEGNIASFQLLEESVRLTSFEFVKEGSLVNVERPLLPNTRLGGHFVSGHVDARAEVVKFEQIGKNIYIRLAFDKSFSKYVVYKGSITIDGISLTIAEAYDGELAVWIIPHTLDVTNLADCNAGKIVNLEFDLLAKYVEKIALGNRDKSPYQ